MIKRGLHRDKPAATQIWRGRSNAPNLSVTVSTLVYRCRGVIWTSEIRIYTRIFLSSCPMVRRGQGKKVSTKRCQRQPVCSSRVQGPYCYIIEDKSLIITSVCSAQAGDPPPFDLVLSHPLLLTSPSKTLLFPVRVLQETICVLVAHNVQEGEWACQVPFFPPHQSAEVREWTNTYRT